MGLLAYASLHMCIKKIQTAVQHEQTAFFRSLAHIASHRAPKVIRIILLTDMRVLRDADRLSSFYQSK